MTDLQLLFIYLLLYSHKQEIEVGDSFTTISAIHHIESGIFYPMFIVDELLEDYDDYINVLKYPDQQTWNERVIEQDFVTELIELINNI